MQYLPLILAILLCLLSITLIVVAFFLIRILIQLHKTTKAFNEIITTSNVSLKTMVQEIFLQLLNKVEIREELIDDLAIRSVSTTKKSSKRRGESKQLFKGL